MTDGLYDGETGRLSPERAQEAAALLERALYEMKKVIVGQQDLLERLLIALMAQGHALVEGAPGLAKTLMLKSLAQALSVGFKRIQFTPDLLPSDLIGARIFNPATGEFATEPGPLFTNFVLADEINRAPAKVQSALLEAMQERQITVGRQTFALEAPFLVMATQNPIESEGTYALPEAQLDRFLFKLLAAYPDAREEAVIVQRMTGADIPQISPVLDADALLRLCDWVGKVYIDPALAHGIVDLIQATRRPPTNALTRAIQFGASPRGSLALTMASKAMALMRGRDYVRSEDVTALAHDCLRHRIILSYEGLAAGMTPDSFLDELLTLLPPPGASRGA
ncbi:MAG: MoxR family ATPase [Vampirovibrionales bacterium]|nr:MoxR family ATPase [Vampirovibrionales bacterium]